MRLYIYVKIEQIRELLGKGKTYEALNILRRVLPEDDEVIIQLSRLNKLQRSNRLGLLSFDEMNREQNKIIHSILGLMREKEKDL